MNIPVKIVAISNHHPEKTEGNDFYIKHFEEKGIDNKTLINEVYKRDSRYLADFDKDTNLELGVKAAEKALQKAGLRGEDMDLIIFCSQLPEYTAPPTSTIIHARLEGKTSALCYDLNTNCTGMVVGLNQAAAQLQQYGFMKRALVIGCDSLNLYTDIEDSAAYGCFGDAASAFILEKEEEGDSCIVDSVFYINNKDQGAFTYPPKGMSQVVQGRSVAPKLVTGAGNPGIETASEVLTEFLKRNHIEMKDIKQFFGSQMAYSNLMKFKEIFDMRDDQISYIGDVYGYTGASSPFLALQDSIDKEIIKRGDFVLFWGLGAGTQHVFTLMRY